MGEALGFIFLRFVIIGAGLFLLVSLIVGLLIVLKRTGRFDQTRNFVEPLVRTKFNNAGAQGALGNKALDYLSNRHGRPEYGDNDQTGPVFQTDNDDVDATRKN